MLYLPDCSGCLGMTEEHGEAVEHELYKGHKFIGYSEGESTCEWVNDECPDSCRTEHDEPEPDDDGQWFCPATGTIYNYCVRCGWTARDRWSSMPTEVNGEWYCDPDEHGFISCERCEEYVSEDSSCYLEDDWDETVQVCSDCFNTEMAARERASHNAPVATGDRVHTCPTCNTPTIHLDELTEAFVCKCTADKLRAARKPVMLCAA